MAANIYLCFLVVTAILSFVVSLDTPPSITSPKFPITHYLPPGERRTLQCVAEGTPAPRYYWTLNGQVISDSDAEGGILNSTSEEGIYQCFAENMVRGNKAIAVSPLITLKKAFLTAWESKPSTVVTATEGEYVTLTCDNIPDSVPRAQFSWYEGGGDGELKPNERIHVDNEGSLHFIYVTSEDVKKNNKFKCGLHNIITDEIKLGSEKTLEVTKTDNALPQHGPELKYRTKQADFMRTLKAKLECVFSGNPIPQITWTNKGQTIADSSKYLIEANGRRLIVKNLDQNDEGTYSCTGSNVVDERVGDVFLNVISGPIWEESIRSQTLPEGRSAVFTCQAKSLPGEEPVSTPMWFRNGQRMSDNNPKYSFNGDRTTLTVKNLNRTTDISCFQCNVSNRHGYEFTDGCLNVVQPIRITKQPKHEQVATKGEIIDLTVVGETDPQLRLRYRWLFNGKVYENENPPHVMQSGEVQEHHFINTSTLSDDEVKAITGTYYRELYHDFERVQVEIIVKRPAKVEGEAFPLWTIGLLAGAVLLLVIVTVSLVFLRRRKLRQLRLQQGDGNYGEDGNTEDESHVHDELVALDDDRSRIFLSADDGTAHYHTISDDDHYHRPRGRSPDNPSEMDKDGEYTNYVTPASDNVHSPVSKTDSSGTVQYITPVAEEGNTTLTSNTVQYITPVAEEGNTTLTSNTVQYITPVAEEGKTTLTSNTVQYITPVAEEGNTPTTINVDEHNIRNYCYEKPRAAEGLDKDSEMDSEGEHIYVPLPSGIHQTPNNKSSSLTGLHISPIAEEINQRAESMDTEESGSTDPEEQTEDGDGYLVPRTKSNDPDEDTEGLDDEGYLIPRTPPRDQEEQNAALGGDGSLIPRAGAFNQEQQTAGPGGDCSFISRSPSNNLEEQAEGLDVEGYAIPWSTSSGPEEQTVDPAGDGSLIPRTPSNDSEEQAESVDGDGYSIPQTTSHVSEEQTTGPDDDSSLILGTISNDPEEKATGLDADDCRISRTTPNHPEGKS